MAGSIHIILLVRLCLACKEQKNVNSLSKYTVRRNKRGGSCIKMRTLYNQYEQRKKVHLLRKGYQTVYEIDEYFLL